MDFQAQDFKRVVKTVFTECKQFDIIAFSLGGRIAIHAIASTASCSPSDPSSCQIKIRKAHITGVSAERGPLAKIIFVSWRDLLTHTPDESSGDVKILMPFAWSLIMATYSDRFLALNGPEKVSSWVEHISSNHKRFGLLELIKQTGKTDPIEVADLIRSSDTQIQLAVGGEDKISIRSEVEKLHAAFQLNNDILVYENCAHAVLNEKALQWRKDGLQFLKS